MANFFDQFDSPAKTPATQGNYFDQYDVPAARRPAPQETAPGPAIDLLKAAGVEQSTKYNNDANPRGTGVEMYAGGPGAVPMKKDVPLWKDVTASGLVGARKGFASLLGLPSDAMYLANRAWQYGTTEGAAKTGLISEEQAQKMRKPIPGEEDRWGSKFFNEKLSKITGDYEPQTTAGEYAQTVGEFAPGALLSATRAREVPGALVKYGLIPGMTSEAAGQYTKGTPWEPYARLAGGAFGSIPGIIADSRNNVAKIVSDATDGVTPQQLASAQKLMDQARAQGTPLSLAEAVQHVTNGATNLGDVQRVVEQSRRGGPIMRYFYADRPAANDAAARGAFDAVSPATNPYEVAPRVQRSAQGVLDQAVDSVNAASRPAYNATTGNPSAVLSNQAFGTLTQNQAVSDALKAVRSDPIKYGDLRMYPDNSVRVLDQVKKYLDDVASGAERAGQNYGSANASSAAKTVRDAIIAEHPRYGSALNIQSMGRTNVVEPLERSPIGQIAGTDNPAQQSRILFDANPLPGSEKAVGATVSAIAKSDPDAARSLVRMKMEQVFNEASQNLQSGPNQFGGAKFASTLIGNSQQAKNLEAAVRALPDGDKTWAGVKNFLEVMEAQGRRQQPGSMTEFNRQIAADLSKGGFGSGPATLASPNKWGSVIKDAYQQFRYGKNTQMLAELLTSPDGVAELQKLGRMFPDSPSAIAATGNLIAGRAAGNPLTPYPIEKLDRGNGQ